MSCFKFHHKHLDYRSTKSLPMQLFFCRRFSRGLSAPDRRVWLSACGWNGRGSFLADPGRVLKVSYCIMGEDSFQFWNKCWSNNAGLVWPQDVAKAVSPDGIFFLSFRMASTNNYVLGFYFGIHKSIYWKIK